MPFPKLPPAPTMSRTKAIHEMCKSCTYDKSVEGTWREQVENCTTRHCPLWQHRPMTIATINMQRTKRTPLNIDALVAGMEDEDTVEA